MMPNLMKRSSGLLIVAMVLSALPACSSAPKLPAEADPAALSTARILDEGELESAWSAQELLDRAPAQSGATIKYPAARSFDLRRFRGRTYAWFMRTKVKPSLDQLGAVDNGGGGGFENLGSGSYMREKEKLSRKTLLKYRGARWNAGQRDYVGAIPDDIVVKIYDKLLEVKPRSTVDSLGYYDRNDPSWPTKNDMAIAIKDAGYRYQPFDLGTLYALTGGLGVKVVIDDKNTNYHVMYKTGATDPSTEVMSGRSFSVSPGRGAADATDPEYLRDLEKYLSETEDQGPFFRSLIQALANNDTSGWAGLSSLGQLVLSDFLTVYTAEADRHLMVNLQDGRHPWEIDLAAVTFVSAVSAEIGKVVVDGQLVQGDLGKWFAPSPNNRPGGPQRSGIGITRRDRQKFQRTIHRRLMEIPAGQQIVADIQRIIGTQSNRNDVIQGVFEYLSSQRTPERMGANADVLANKMAELASLARAQAPQIGGLVASTR